MKHESIKEDKEITLEAVFHQIETQYRVVSDMMNQIYKSIPLSALVRLKASAKIIGALFIAFTSDKAYTSNNEIEISLDHEEAESKGFYILNDLLNENQQILPLFLDLLPEFGYKLDDNGNKHLITDGDNKDLETSWIANLLLNEEENLLEAATHPYIFEFIWSIYLNERINYVTNYCSFNRRDIIEIIYESTKRLEDLELKKDVSDMLNRELTIAVIYGHVLSTKYLVEIVGADLKIYWDTFHHVFLIKDTEKRFRFLNFLYYSKVLCQYMEFDYEAQEGNYENVVWLVEHGYKGWDALSELEEDLNEQGALDV